MSYLQRPRLNFAGRFEADVSTVNNNPANYNDAQFLPEYDSPGVAVGTAGDMTNGWWNPTGSGIWRLVDCAVTSVVSAKDRAGAAPDPVLTMMIEDAGDRAPAKLVDLDPMQQMVSTIFGLQMRLVDTKTGDALFTGEFAAAPFSNIWFGRSPNIPNQSAFFQSQLIDAQGRGPVWSSASSGSAFVEELREAAGDLPLSVRFVVDAFIGNSKSAQFPTGRIVGTIGVARLGEPRHFVRGRQLLVPLNLTAQPSDPAYGQPVTSNVNHAVAIVAGDTLVLDVANTLLTATRGGPLLDVGTVSVGMVSGDGTFTPVGTLPQTDPGKYTEPGWLESTGGIVEIPLGEHAGAVAHTPLAISIPAAAPGGTASVFPIEAPTAEHVRADKFVFRGDPGYPIDVRIFTTKFGAPYDAEVAIALDPLTSYLNVLQPRAADPALPGFPGQAGPPPGTPPDRLVFPGSVHTRNGSATLRIQTLPPNNPRGYIDGQVYTIRPTLATLPPEFVNGWDTVSILLFDETLIPDQPTWWDDVQPILQQYANLYPIMRKVLDLDDYVSVIAHKNMLTMVFGVPEDHPNCMPVTRDLSPTKRALLLKWLASAGEPYLGAMPPQLSAPNSKKAFVLKTRMSLAADVVADDGAERDGDISGKDHALKALLATRSTESPT